MNSISQGPERFSTPDKDGVQDKRPATALEDLTTEVSRAASARAAGANAAGLREISSIASRADLREAAFNELKLASPQASRLVELPASVAKQWTDLDATEFARLRSPERREAALEAVAAALRQVPEYASELAQRSPTLAKAAGRFNGDLVQLQGERDRRTVERQASGQEGAQAAEAVLAKAVVEHLTLDAHLLTRLADMRAQQSHAAYEALAADRRANESVARAAEARAAQVASQADAIEASAYATVARRRAEDSRAAAEALGLLPQSERSPHAPQASHQAPQDHTVRPQPVRQADEPVRLSPEAANDPAGEAPRRALKRPMLEEEVPDDIRRRYLVTQEQAGWLDRGRTEFTFRGGERDGQLAFSDMGKQLTTRTEDKDVIRAMVTVATAKGWNDVTVSGTDEFRRAAWLQARLAGLQVHGYEPKQADQRRLAELERDKAPTNAISQSAPHRTREPAQAAEHIDAGRTPMNVEALRARLALELASPAPDRLERTQLTRTGDSRAQAAIRADGELRSERDMATIRGMNADQLKDLARWVDAAPSAEKEQRIRAVLDGAARHEPAHGDQAPRPGSTATPSPMGAHRNPPTVHVDGDALSPKERKVMQGLGELLKGRGYGPEFVDATLAEVENRMRRQRVHVGELIEHGGAPYRGDQSKDMSYYVTLKTAAGVETVWGKRLGAAIQEGNVKQGDQIVLINTGRQPVDVTERARGDDGQVTARRKPAERNEWAARPIDRLSSIERDDADRRAGQQPALQVVDPNAQPTVNQSAGQRPADRQRGIDPRQHARVREADPER